MNVLDFDLKKVEGEKISMVTAYDFFSAKSVEAARVDCILVGDSVGMVVHGYEDTLSVDVPMMELHTKAVRKGAPNTFVISDLPFLSYRVGLEKAVENAGVLIRAGANAVKLEGARGNLELVEHLVDSGIPVMGHLGLTPQSVNSLGGFKVQAKTLEARKRLLDESKALEAAGCFSLVLECVPREVASEITQELGIPVIGIGCGVETDGQVLVWHDLLGSSINSNHVL